MPTPPSVAANVNDPGASVVDSGLGVADGDVLEDDAEGAGVDPASSDDSELHPANSRAAILTGTRTFFIASSMSRLMSPHSTND